MHETPYRQSVPRDRLADPGLIGLGPQQQIVIGDTGETMRGQRRDLGDGIRIGEVAKQRRIRRANAEMTGEAGHASPPKKSISARLNAAGRSCWTR